MKLKPLPKLILIFGAVGAVGYAASVALKSTPTAEPTVTSVPAPTVTTVDPSDAKAAAEAAVQRAREAAVAAPAPAPVAPAAPLLTPAPTNDAGVANVLGTTKK